jgi:hypothetical protein
LQDFSTARDSALQAAILCDQSSRTV